MRAACYLRSSKDRSDISPAAQRHELERLAASRSLQIVATFEDAVQSGSTEDRPGFIDLLRAIKNPLRGWAVLLVYDTSRIARGRYIAQAFKHEAKKRGVTIHYARMPSDLDPVSAVVLESVFEAMDEAHSIMSREKGLAGMAENVRQGWRAGGRAPIGYRLELHATGAIREGKPVTKSKLIPNEDAPRVARYLKERARGTPRVLVRALVDRPDSTLVAVEWNALTYAGHTVWNRHAPQGTGRKRRTREDWQLQRDTHPPLITDAEAETILAQLETSDMSATVSRAKAAMSPHLLSGILVTTDGAPWVAHQRYYRLRRNGERRGTLTRADAIEGAVLAQLRADLASDLFLAQLAAAARRVQQQPATNVEAQIRDLERQRMRAATLAITEDGGPYAELAAKVGRQIEALKREAAALNTDNTLAGELARMTPASLRDLLATEPITGLVGRLVQAVEMDPGQPDARLFYRASQWLPVASPGRCAGWPPELTRTLVLRRA